MAVSLLVRGHDEMSDSQLFGCAGQMAKLAVRSTSPPIAPVVILLIERLLRE